MKTIIPILFLMSCAELRSGWVKTDFAQGVVEPVMVCEFYKDRDGDFASTCHTIDEVKKQISEQQRLKTEM